MSIKKTRLVLLLASLILCLASFLPAVAVQAEDTFKVNAKAAFAVDAQSGKILYDQDGEKTMGIASITKIIGLYIVLDQVKEGIENKIYANIFKCNTLDELISSTKSKRYTLTKIKRTLNNILLGIEKEDVMKTKNLCKMPYIRVLAFNDKGREIIKKIKDSSDIEIITKFSKVDHIDDPIFNTLIKYDIKSSNIYNLIYYKNNQNLLKGPMDYYISPKYVH